jgi:hypothetical protein
MIRRSSATLIVIGMVGLMMLQSGVTRMSSGTLKVSGGHVTSEK